MTTIGLIQLLEIYASTSLEGQHSKHFPTQVWSKIKKSQEELKKLGEKWQWGETEMIYSAIEAPTKIIKRLRDEGRFEPKLKQKNLVRQQQMMRDSGLLEEEQKLKDLFNDDNEQIIPLAGEIIMEVETTEEMVKAVEVELSKYAKEIFTEWKKRHVQTNLEKAASALFSEEVFEEINVEEVDSWDAFEVDEENLPNEKKKRLLLLKNLISELPSYQGERFDYKLIYPGLDSWLTFLKNNLEPAEGKKKKTHDAIYADWFKCFVSCEDALESNILFTKLFQNIQIRSSSEVKSFVIKKNYLKIQFM